MLLIMCHVHSHRYAIAARHVSEVLPFVRLQSLSAAPPSFAGMLLCRGSAIPVMDLGEVTCDTPCARRLSSRIIVLQAQRGAHRRHVGVLAENVGLRERRDEPGSSPGEIGGAGDLGPLCLDEQGVFQLIDVPHLFSPEWQAFLFPGAEAQR